MLGFSQRRIARNTTAAGTAASTCWRAFYSALDSRLHTLVCDGSVRANRSCSMDPHRFAPAANGLSDGRSMKNKTSFFACVFLCVVISPALCAQQAPADAPYLNSKLSAEQRADDLISRMTLEEKVDQLGHI